MQRISGRGKGPCCCCRWDLPAPSALQMSFGVYSYVCIYVCMHACIYIYMYVSMHIYMYLCMRMNVYMHAWTIEWYIFFFVKPPSHTLLKWVSLWTVWHSPFFIHAISRLFTVPTHYAIFRSICTYTTATALRNIITSPLLWVWANWATLVCLGLSSTQLLLWRCGYLSVSLSLSLYFG